MTEILDRPPDEPDGDDQKAKTDDVEVVTRVDFLEAPELDEDDPEPEDATDDA